MSIATAAAAGPTLTPAEMLERVRAWVYALAHRYADRAGVSVEDFAHELRVEMFIRAANFNPAKGSLTGWVAWQARAALFRLTRRRISDIPTVPLSTLVRNADGEPIGASVGRDDPDAAAGRLERREAEQRARKIVRRALARLTPAQAAEVARYFGLRTRPRRPGNPSPDTVRQHVHAGVCTLATVPELADLAREYGITPAAGSGGGKARRRRLKYHRATAGGVV